MTYQIPMLVYVDVVKDEPQSFALMLDFIPSNLGVN
jgi:hypothetical protein